MHWISADFWRERRVLVTGASGFIGTWVAHLLTEAQAEVYAVGHTRTPSAGHQRTRADLLGSAKAVIAWSRPEVIFHLAAPVLLESDAAEDVLQRGVVGVTTELLAAIQGEPTRMIYAGSCAEYGRVPAPYAEDQVPAPTSAYGRAKSTASAQVLELGHTVVRPFRAIGPGDTSSVVAAAAQAALSGQPFEMTTGEQVREWNHVSAIARGIIAAGAHENAAGCALNLGGGQTSSVRSVVEQVFTLAGADLGQLRVGARPQRPGEVPLLSGNHERSRALWGVLPQPDLSVTLAEAVDWTRRQQDGAA